MKNLDEKFPVVNITFVDDFKLIHCVIFEEDDIVKNLPSITNVDLIKKKFQKLPWYSRWNG
jgi:hypothetical protein